MLTKETKVALANEQKVQAVGEKIFDSHITTILTQALLQQNDILDCLIVINLIEATDSRSEARLRVSFRNLFC